MKGSRNSNPSPIFQAKARNGFIPRLMWAPVNELVAQHVAAANARTSAIIRKSPRHCTASRIPHRQSVEPGRAQIGLVHSQTRGTMMPTHEGPRARPDNGEAR